MPSDYERKAQIKAQHDPRNCYLHEFKLYETESKFYMIGRNKNRTVWRVLKIERSNPSELNFHEDSTTYSERECNELLDRIDERNWSTGGLNFVTYCYGIIGFIKFLGPYYMLLITEREQIGTICGHEVYAVAKSEMISLPYSTVKSNMDYSKDENRYKKLLCSIDLTKDFFFSYSYHVMHSLQKNLCDNEAGQVPYETMFVWNEFLTRGIRNHLKNTLWTVALVFGFFKQEKISMSGRDFKLTLIARRSRHHAGTRYLKRGVNEKGRVANDVETEQIVSEDVSEGCLAQISSVVQNRGSLPLFWSQEASWLNIKPDIILQENQNYEATRLHFENLVTRYGNPIIILNLIKTIESEKKPRESILGAEFAKAIELINKDLPEENHLKFLHWDLAKHYKSKGTNVLELLSKVAAYVLDFTGVFYCQITSALRLEGSVKRPFLERDPVAWSLQNHYNINSGNADLLQTGAWEDNVNIRKNCLVRPPLIQKGVLRTNCIDCLDRTNNAQYAYGLAALGHQLHALGFLDVPKVDLYTPLANYLMGFYEGMGDTLALQYGGSTAHNKIFSEIRGQWKAATQSQEFFKSIQRYYSNAYMDAQKQDAVNVFLGYFQPQQGKLALWEMDSNQHYNVRTCASTEKLAWLKKRSLSDESIVCADKIPVPSTTVGQKKLPNLASPKSVFQEPASTDHSGSTMEFSTCENDIPNSRYTPSMTGRQLFEDMERERCLANHLIYAPGGGDSFSSSNFLDTGWISSSGTSSEEGIHDRSSSINSSYSDEFMRWVIHGENLCH